MKHDLGVLYGKKLSRNGIFASFKFCAFFDYILDFAAYQFGDSP